MFSLPSRMKTFPALRFLYGQSKIGFRLPQKSPDRQQFEPSLFSYFSVRLQCMLICLHRILSVNWYARCDWSILRVVFHCTARQFENSFFSACPINQRDTTSNNQRIIIIRAKCSMISIPGSLSFVTSSAPAICAGCQMLRPKIHRPTTSPIKSRLKSVLEVRSSYVERNKYLTRNTSLAKPRAIARLVS